MLPHAPLDKEEARHEEHKGDACHALANHPSVNAVETRNDRYQGHLIDLRPAQEVSREQVPPEGGDEC
ncbi:hypothetical protein AXF24_12715 [Streptococcus pneumoniae]|nr:hypothetical protein AWW74_12730 [Streptococcus pneumoniae]KXB94558.1 hypothetical protein AXF24_12715 [Streptococcus pneumoniae]